MEKEGKYKGIKEGNREKKGKKRGKGAYTQTWERRMRKEGVEKGENK